MKKALFLLIPLFLIFTTSCDNFMNGSDVQEQLNQMIDVATAKSCTLIVSQDNTMGSFLSAGDKSCKLGYSIEVQYTVKKDQYIYKGLKAVSKSDETESMASYVEFTQTDGDDTRGVYKTSIKLVKESDDILIMPDCTLLPSIDSNKCKPDYTRDWEQDSSIQIVFNKPVTATEFFVPVVTDISGQNLASYFAEPYFSADSTTLIIPTNKANKLIDPKGSITTKDIIVTIDLTNIKDQDGNSGTGSVQHKYRVGKTTDTVPPVFDSINVYSTDDKDSPYYKELSTKAFSEWTGTSTDAGDFGAQRVSDSIYVEFEGSDEGSGVGGVSVKETHYKYTDGSSAGIVTGTFSVTSTPDKETGKNYFTYNMKTPSDGIILLEFNVEDNAGNVSTASKSIYVLKYTLIDSATVKFKNENDLITTSYPTGKEYIEKISSLYTDNADGSQTIKLSFRESTKDVYYDEYSSPYELSVSWGYEENSFTEIAKASDNSYSLNRDPSKVVFIKVYCKDSVGNEKTIKKIIPPALEIESVYKDGAYRYAIVNIESYLSLCNIKFNPNQIAGYFSTLGIYNIKCTGDSEKKTYYHLYDGNQFSTFEVNAFFDNFSEALANNFGVLSEAEYSGHGKCTEELLSRKPVGNYTVMPVANFGDFPGPRAVNNVELTSSSWAYGESPSGEPLPSFDSEDAEGYAQLYVWSNIIHDGDGSGLQDILVVYGNQSGITNENAESEKDISQADVVIGFSDDGKQIPINEKLTVSVTPIKNLGLFKVEIDDYKNAAYQGIENVSYFFYLDKLTEQQTNNMPWEQPFTTINGTAQKSPTMYCVLDINSVSTKFTVRVEAYDKKTGKYYVPVLSMSILQSMEPSENSGFVDPYSFIGRFADILISQEMPITNGTASYDNYEEVSAFVSTLQENNGVIDYINTYFTREAYQRLTMEGVDSKYAAEDLSLTYEGFKRTDGKAFWYSCEADVTPPEFMYDYLSQERSFLAMTSPRDKNLKLENGQAELSYYVIPCQSNNLLMYTLYSQEELESNYSRYKKTMKYYPTTDGINGNLETVVIPFGNTKQGINTVYIIVEDAYGNTTMEYYPILTTSFGKLPMEISYKVITETHTDDLGNIGQSSYPAWDFKLDFSNRNDILESGSLPQGISVELQHLQGWRGTWISNTYNQNPINFISDDAKSEENPLCFETIIRPSDFNNSDEFDTWGRIYASILPDQNDPSVIGKGYFYSQYVYTGRDGPECQVKNCTEGLNGYIVYSDRPVLAHTMFSMEKLTDSKNDKDAVVIWENEGAETGLTVVNHYVIESNNEPYIIPNTETLIGNYGLDKLKYVPEGAYYTTIFHFADGTVVMTDIKQKQ